MRMKLVMDGSEDIPAKWYPESVRDLLESIDDEWRVADSRMASCVALVESRDTDRIGEVAGHIVAVVHTSQRRSKVSCRSVKSATDLIAKSCRLLAGNGHSCKRLPRWTCCGI